MYKGKQMKQLKVFFKKQETNLIAEYTLPMMNGIDLCEVIQRINPETDFY